MQPLVHRHEFHDFGQYREQLRCWDTEATQVSRGPLTIALDLFDAGDLILSHLRFDRSAVLRTTRNAGWRTLVVDFSPVRAWGIDIPAGSLINLAPQRESHVVNREPFDTIGITVRHDELATWDAPLADLAAWDPAPERSVFATAPAAFARFSAWVEELYAVETQASHKDDATLWVDAIRQRLRQHLQDILGRREHLQPVSAVRRVARYDLALAALRLINATEEDRRLTVTNLAGALGVSVRALEYAFFTVLGFSPAQFLLADRLNRARHHLRIDGAAGGSVTTVAFDHQFENLSRFAQQYARLFGERPSDTLRAARLSFNRA